MASGESVTSFEPRGTIARAPEAEDALPLGERALGIGGGVEEDVAVIERGDQPDLP
jgi:hypothetical protein